MSYETIFCPECSPVFVKSKPEQRCGVVLTEIETNYSGCGVDIYECKKCNGRFQVSYKVDQILKID